MTPAQRCPSRPIPPSVKYRYIPAANYLSPLSRMIFFSYPLPRMCLSSQWARFLFRASMVFCTTRWALLTSPALKEAALSLFSFPRFFLFYVSQCRIRVPSPWFTMADGKPSPIPPSPVEGFSRVIILVKYGSSVE